MLIFNRPTMKVKLPFWQKKVLLLVPLLILSGCVRSQPQIIVITATPTVGTIVPQPTNLPLVTDTPPIISTPSASAINSNQTTIPQDYIVQAGDTLTAIAERFGMSVESILDINEIVNPNILSIGQVIRLPPLPQEFSSSFTILPDVKLVRGPGSSLFDVDLFMAQYTGRIKLVTDLVENKLLTGTEIVKQVSMEFSVDPRLLLALLEYRSRWITSQDQSEEEITFPIVKAQLSDAVDRSGLYRQLAWTANQLNRGYYNWKYNGLRTLELGDGTRLLYDQSLNAATVAIQHLFSLLEPDYPKWTLTISEEGFFTTYHQLFDNPFMNVVDPVVPPTIEQPFLTLPFASGEIWFFTGGAHGGWGSGSAWSAIDFAPPDDRPDGSPLCYVSDYWARAAAPGVIARSADGAVVLDLDGDGDETTGWSILYLHIATENRIQVGVSVQLGDPIGHPSCEGGVSTATHMHIARRYNGEWIPVDCSQCPDKYKIPEFVMSGWTIYGLTNQEYQGYMVNGGEQRTAEQGRLTPINRVSW